MLRRVARVLRMALAANGVICLVFWPLSPLFLVGAELSTAFEVVASLWLGYGQLDLSCWPGGIYDASDLYFHCGRNPAEYSWSFKQGLLPTANWGNGGLIAKIPLWLLAAICLAWPVTSFIIARRRHKRGFPVVQAELRDQKSEVSQRPEQT